MIGIIGAMDEEIQYLLEHMEDKQEVTVAHSRFIKGELEGKEIVLLKSGIGKVNAAMGTTITLSCVTSHRAAATVRPMSSSRHDQAAAERTESGTAVAPGRPGGSGSGVLCWSVCALTAQP